MAALDRKTTTHMFKGHSSVAGALDLTLEPGSQIGNINSALIVKIYEHFPRDVLQEA